MNNDEIPFTGSRSLRPADGLQRRRSNPTEAAPQQISSLCYDTASLSHLFAPNATEGPLCASIGTQAATLDLNPPPGGNRL